MTNAVLAAVFDLADDAVVIANEHHRIVAFNAGAERIFAYSNQDVVGKPLSVLIPERYRQVHADHTRAFFQSPTPSRRMSERGQICGLRRGGAEFPAEASITRVTINGSVFFAAIVRDVTAQHRDAEALLVKTRQLQTISDAMAAFLQQGEWQTPSHLLLRGALEQTGSADGFVGVIGEGPVLRILAHEGVNWHQTANREFYERATREYQERGYLEFSKFDNLFGRVITDKKAVLSNDPAGDPRSQGLPKGHPAPLNFLGVPVISGSEVVGTIAVANRPGGYTSREQGTLEILAKMAGVLFDSYRRQQREESLEEQLRQSQKLEALGSLAGGVAHDFNNLLTVILGYCESASANVGDNDTFRGDLREIRQAGVRASGLVRQLLAFGRRQLLRPFRVDLNAVVSDVSAMLHRLIGEQVELVLRFDLDVAPVEADLGQLEQVIVNLVVNAKDAMEKGGRLTIAVENVRFAAHDHRLPIGCGAGEYVVLRVTDTGPGMDVQTKARIFEPFFTTKERGRGTGLGLAMVYGFVQQSGGAITVDSAPGQGTTFTIYLRRSAGPLEQATRHHHSSSDSFGTETVLVVEDEPQVLALASRTLDRYGYTVVEAQCPYDALRLAREHEKIDLILSDIVMPKMNGLELVPLLQTIHPEVRVCFVSGHSHDLNLYRDIVKSGAILLEKPFSPAMLAAVVRDTLDQATQVGPRSTTEHPR